MNGQSGSCSSTQNQQLLIAAKSLLSTISQSQKRPSCTVTKEVKADKKTSTSKRQKLNTVPKAESTLRSDVLAKFAKFQQSKKVKEFVPKTKITLTNNPILMKANSTTGCEIQAQQPPQNEHGLTNVQMNDILKKIATGQIDLSQIMKNDSQGKLTTLEETCPKNEIEDSDEICDATSDSENCYETQPTSPSESLKSNNAANDAYDPGLLEDPLANQANEPCVQEYEVEIPNEVVQEADPQVSPTPDSVPMVEESSEGKIVVLDGNINIAGVNLNLSEVQNVLHSENCCTPCRQTLIIILEKLNLILEKLSKVSQGRENVPVAAGAQVVLNNFRPELYQLMPKYPLGTQIDLVTFNSLLETNEETVGEFMALINPVVGRNPDDEMRKILGELIEDDLSDHCTWAMQTNDKTGEPKLVVGKYIVFKIITAVVMTKWQGVKDKNGLEIRISLESAAEGMQIWIRRSSTRIARKTAKSENPKTKATKAK